MIYSHVVTGRFLARPNRFIAQVELDGQPVTAHVKNTGRCRELLLPGAVVYLQDHGPAPAGRKTRYDLIAVEKARPGQMPLLINMDAQAPNKVFGEWAERGSFRPDLTLLRPETAWGSSRFDFYYETAGGTRGFVEVKGVTLEEGGLAAFPDAPTSAESGIWRSWPGRWARAMPPRSALWFRWPACLASVPMSAPTPLSVPPCAGRRRRGWRSRLWNVP